jgi:tRNA(Arg) A34 adenosine deaminase TadA
MPEARFMRMAIEAARAGIAKGNHPYGATIVRDEQVICSVHNVVPTTVDATAHAEVTAIREACRMLHTVDLAGCDIYCTCEPCAMCFSAIHWANFRTAIFGASILDKDPFGLFDIGPRAGDLLGMMRKPLVLVQEFLREECVPLFAEFTSKGK